MLASDLPMSDDEDEEEVTNPDAVEGGRTSLQIVTVLAEGAFQFALPSHHPDPSLASPRHRVAAVAA